MRYTFLSHVANINSYGRANNGALLAHFTRLYLFKNLRVSPKRFEYDIEFDTTIVLVLSFFFFHFTTVMLWSGYELRLLFIE